MKLYNVPRNTRIRVVADISIPPCASQIPTNVELNFKHIDGMFSLCYDDEGNACYLGAGAEVEIVNQISTVPKDCN